MELEKVIPIKMASLADLVRLAMSISTPQTTTYVIKYSDGDKVVLGILGIFRDYYKYYGIPIFYYYTSSGEEAGKIVDANYIVVSTNGEKFEFSKNPKPGLSIPIIGLSEKPPFIPDLLV